MKYLHATNHSSDALYFLFCTISRCTCSICEQWLIFETYPISGSPGWTFGVLIVDAYSARIERFCPQWDCIGACYFSKVPSFITKAEFFDFDETTNYEIADGKATLRFSASYSAQTIKPASVRAIDGTDKSVIGAAAGAGLVGVSMGLTEALGVARNVHAVYEAGSYAYDSFGGDGGESASETVGAVIESVAECVIS